MKMYFQSYSQTSATPLKVIVGEYEISLAGDDNIRYLDCKSETERCRDNQPHILDRLSIIVFKDGKEVEEITHITFDDFVKVVTKYREI